MESKTFLFIGDMHVGSAYAPFPQNFQLSNGNVPTLNPGQDYLNIVLGNILSLIPRRLDGIFMMGDMIDGTNYKDKGRYLTEVDARYQVLAANQLLSPFISRVKPGGLLRLMSGSKYHVEGNEAYLADIVGSDRECTVHSQLLQPIFSEDVFVIDAAHHQSYTQTTKVMPLEREVRTSMEKYGRDRLKRPQHTLIARAHTHHGYRLYQDEVATAISCPSLKLQDPFASGGKTPNNTRPDSLGVILVNVMDEFPYVHVTPIIAPHPKFNMEDAYA